MIEYNGKKFLNEQEAYLYCMQQINEIKQILGSAAPDPIAGPTGPQGAAGPQGATGPRGKGFYGVTAELPSATAYEEGDFYVLFNGNVYKKIGEDWLLQFNIKGPQGAVGLPGGTEVIANPASAFTDFLVKLKIDGTTYAIPTGNYVKLMDAPASEFLTDEQKNTIKGGVFINGNYLGLKNPVFFPARTDSGYSVGIVIGAYPNMFYTNQLSYVINEETNEIGFNDEKRFELSAIYSINGKMLPNYPSNPSYRRKLCYNTNNSLSWENDVIVRHNVTLEINSNSWLTFMIINDDPAPITDISELLEEKNQLIGGTAALNDGNSVIAVTIATFGEGDLAIDIGGGYQHIDYNDDITDITDHQTPVIY